MDYDEKCQLLIIGDSTVGKTSILSRFTNGTFNANYLATVGLDFFTKDEVINGKNVRIKIWDTAGQERYKALTKGFFRNAQGIMVVYDVTNLETFDNLKYWIDSIKTHMGEGKESVPVIIIGNKIDASEKEVKNEEASKFANEKGYKYFETSAKTGEGIEISIRYLVSEVIKNDNINNINSTMNNNIKINSKKKKEGNKDGKCC